MARKTEQKGQSRAGYLPESTVGDQSYRKSRSFRKAISTPSPAEPILSGQTLHKRIAEKAYELYEKRGQTHGHDLEDWLEAEKALLLERSAELNARIFIPRRRARPSPKAH